MSASDKDDKAVAAAAPAAEEEEKKAEDAEEEEEESVSEGEDENEAPAAAPKEAEGEGEGEEEEAAALAGPTLTGAERDTRLAEAESLYQQAATYLEIKDYLKASDILSTVLEIKTAAYGEMDVRLVEAYFKYGRSLLMAAKASSKGMDGVISRERVAGAGQGEDDYEDGDEDGSEMLEAAWEALEVARVIAEKNKGGTPQEELRLSDMYVDLGEVALECGREDQAVEDIRKALEIRARLLPQSDRRVAEAHYSLGIASSGREAREQFELASKSLHARLEAVGAESDEARDLREIIADVEARREEVQEDPMEQAAREFLRKALDPKGEKEEAPAAPQAAPAGPVRDLGVLGHSRKRAAPDTSASAGDAVQEPGAKVPRTD